ncbi:MAG: FHA domain-containing protein, partial [Verrucomicrobiales bacterium]|nr:FHA domain-containing protein [Verrucomicrobiales bacterium]
MSLRYHLLVAIPENDPISFSISEDIVKVGRNPANDIQILVQQISTSHCELKATDSGYQIIDSGSTNGTKVNDHPVREPVELNSKDVILLGETVLTYFIAAEEGAELDIKSEIAEIEKARSMPVKSTAKNPTVPGVVKKVGLPTRPPQEAVPVAVEDPADDDNAGAAAQIPPRPATTPGALPVKPVPPGAPPAVTKLPMAAPPAKKLAAPGTSDEPSASPPPSTKPGGPPVKPVSPGAPPAVTKLPLASPPVKKVAAPGTSDEP